MNATIRIRERQLLAHYASFPMRTARALKLAALLDNEPARQATRRISDAQFDVEAEARRQGITLGDYLSEGG